MRIMLTVMASIALLYAVYQFAVTGKAMWFAFCAFCGLFISLTWRVKHLK